MAHKIYYFHNLPPIWPNIKKVVARLSEHGDVIETQTMHNNNFVPLKFCLFYATTRQRSKTTNPPKPAGVDHHERNSESA